MLTCASICLHPLAEWSGLANFANRNALDTVTAWLILDDLYASHSASGYRDIVIRLRTMRSMTKKTGGSNRASTSVFAREVFTARGFTSPLIFARLYSMLETVPSRV